MLFNVSWTVNALREACVYNRCIESPSSLDGGVDARPVMDSAMTDASQPITDAAQAIDGSLVDSSVATSDMTVARDAQTPVTPKCLQISVLRTVLLKTPKSVTLVFHSMPAPLTQQYSKTQSRLTRPPVRRFTE